MPLFRMLLWRRFPAALAVASLAAFLLGTPGARAKDNLANAIPSLYGGDGITLAPPEMGFSHAAHFTDEALVELNELNSGITANLGRVALSSTVAGYTFDMELGVPVRSTDSFGPILSERAETLGKSKLNVGCEYARVAFKEFQGQELKNLQLIFPHEDVNGDGVLGPNPDAPPPFNVIDFELDQIAVDLDLEINQDVYACYATVGVLPRVDIGVAIPFLRTTLRADAHAFIVERAVVSPHLHEFDLTGEEGDLPDSSVRGDSGGIGDVLLRGKYNFLRDSESVWIPDLAALGEVKFETGDEDDLLGTGDTRIRLLLIASRPYRIVAPHVNLGWEYVPGHTEFNNFRYAVGFDLRAHERITFVMDFLGALAYDADEPGDHIVDYAVGVKANLWRSLLFVLNFTVPINKSEGLRTNFIPSVGLEYTFGGPE
jgi:hypothetical protein